jgi:hypothetical protein
MTRTRNQFARRLMLPGRQRDSSAKVRRRRTYCQDDGDYKIQHGGDDIDRFIGDITQWITSSRQNKHCIKLTDRSGEMPNG